MQLETLFTEMANALRTKEETTGKISAESFPQRINDLKVLDTTDATATADDVVAGKIVYAKGKRLIGTILDNGPLEYTPSDEEQIIPSGLTSGGVVKAIESEEVVIVPTTEEQVKEGLFNKITVPAIKGEDLTVTPTNEEQKFNGLYENVTVEGGLDTTDATATSEDIASGKTAYVNGVKVKGTMAPAFDTSLITSANHIFYQSTFTEFGDIDLPNTTTISKMFEKNTNLETIGNINCPKCVNFNHVVDGCTSLKKVGNINASEQLNGDASNMFNGLGTLEEVGDITLPKTTTLAGMFWSNWALKKVGKLTLGTATDISSMFRYCGVLEDVPMFDTSTVTSYQYAFTGCTNLNDNSLNNIMQMCINMVNVTSNKTLNYIGLTSDQATRCQALSNYQAFLDARLDLRLLKL